MRNRNAVQQQQAQGWWWKWVGIVVAVLAGLVDLGIAELDLWKDELSGDARRRVFVTLAVLFVAGPLLSGVAWLVQRRQAKTVAYAEWLNRVSTLVRELPDGALPRLSTLSDAALGATKTRYTRDGKDRYVQRGDFDARLRAALTPTQPPYPFVVVWGDAKAGKSRTTLEALRSVFHDADPQVVLPAPGKLEEFKQLQPPLRLDAPAVVWLDNITAVQLGQLTGTVLDWLCQRAVVVGTLTAVERDKAKSTSGEVTAIARAALRRAKIDEIGEAEQFHLPFTASEDELEQARQLYPEEQFATGPTSIAETLIAGVELVDKYRNGHNECPAGQALVRVAVDLQRAGLNRPATEEELRRFFSAYLRDITVARVPRQAFDEGLTWAQDPVSSRVALLTPTGDGNRGEGWSVLPYLAAVDDGQREHVQRPVPAYMWRQLIDSVSASEVWGVALSAFHAGYRDDAKAGWERAVKEGASATAEATAYLGFLLQERGDAAGARAAYEVAIDSGHHSIVPRAAYNLGNLLYEHDDAIGARAAFQLAIDSGDHEITPIAAVNLGLLLRTQDDAAGARAAFQLAIDGDDRDQKIKAAANLGDLLQELGDEEGAQKAFQLAIYTSYETAKMMFNFGVKAQEQGDVTGARAAYQLAIDWGQPDIAPLAAVNLGLLLQTQDDAAGARAAFQVAIDSGHPDQKPKAAYNLGVLLNEQGDVAGARAAFQLAIDSGHPHIAPEVAVNFGVLLDQQGDAAGARAAYQLAIDSGHPDMKPAAAYNLGNLLKDEGDMARARAAFQLATDSGHPELSPRAAVQLGLLLHKQGDLVEARAAYQLAIDSGLPDLTPWAAVALGDLLKEQGDMAGARAAFQLAIDSDEDAGALALRILQELDPRG